MQPVGNAGLHRRVALPLWLLPHLWRQRCQRVLCRRLLPAAPCRLQLPIHIHPCFPRLLLLLVLVLPRGGRLGTGSRLLLLLAAASCRRRRRAVGLRLLPHRGAAGEVRQVHAAPRVLVVV